MHLLLMKKNLSNSVKVKEIHSKWIKYGADYCIQKACKSSLFKYKFGGGETETTYFALFWPSVQNKHYAIYVDAMTCGNMSTFENPSAKTRCDTPTYPRSQHS